MYIHPFLPYISPTKKKKMKINEILPFLACVYIHDKDVGVLAESLHLVTDQWIQYKLGKQYLRKKVAQPWELNPGPTPIRGKLTSIKEFFLAFSPFFRNLSLGSRGSNGLRLSEFAQISEFFQF